ncbi:putative s-adenosylmethionine synthetase [Escherichia coli 2-222-05_S4_C2]|nr:putative s-adenosylmethionine synthetase [Escherichia coli 2-011-08_S1_C1]KDX91535.1 putative s-adenosylmethionine synthetase [Escherichia coli 2-222-05_S4_C2]KEO14696.1 putative s-adenosylmethionine synthetase [Escherichia coli 2-222-05_S4_C3]
MDRRSRRIRQKAARTITSFFLNTFYRKLSSLLKPITPTTPEKDL